jgi:hypothetical protein
LGSVTIAFLRDGVVYPTPNPQPRGPGCYVMNPGVYTKIISKKFYGNHCVLQYTLICIVVYVQMNGSIHLDKTSDFRFSRRWCR